MTSRLETSRYRDFSQFFELSGHFLDHPEPSRFSRYISTSSRLFLEYPDTFFRLSGHFLHHMENFQFIPTLHIIWIFCIVSGHFPKYPEILQQIMSSLQKLSGFAKTFWSALLTRWRGFSDSACDQGEQSVQLYAVKITCF